MSNTAPKRTHIQIERDRREIADLYLKGWLQQEIADHINADTERDYTLTQQMISYDLKRLQEQWQKSALVDVDELKAKELAKVDRLEREYWRAWERSREDAETLQQVGGKDGPDKITKTSKGQAGDPRFLQGVQWCIERRCKILGVDAPEKRELSGRDGGPIETKTNVTGIDRGFAEALALLDEARKRSDAGNPPSNNE